MAADYNNDDRIDEAVTQLRHLRGSIQDLQGAVDHHAYGVQVLPLTNDSVGASAAAVMNGNADEFVSALRTGMSDMLKVVDEQLDEMPS